MLKTERENLMDDIRAIADKHGRQRAALMPILQEIQRNYHYISDFAMQAVADLLSIHPVEVHGVVSFYSFLKEKPQGRFVIRLCRTISCDMAGKDRIARQLENDLGIKFGETTPDGNFTLEWANCLGLCDQGPALLVNDKAYTHVKPENVHEILESCRRSMTAYATQHREEHLV